MSLDEDIARASVELGKLQTLIESTVWGQVEEWCDEGIEIERRNLEDLASQPELLRYSQGALRAFRRLKETPKNLIEQIEDELGTLRKEREIEEGQGRDGA